MSQSIYEVEVAGIKHTVQMDDAEAKEKGLKKVGDVTVVEPVAQPVLDEKGAPAKPNKAGKPGNKADGDGTDA